MVISGVIPMDLLIKERGETQGKNKAEKREARRTTMNRWQQKWEEADKGRWTYALIPNIEVWLNRKTGNINYYITQFLTGHGLFMSYLHKIGIRQRDTCMYCPLPDTSEHTFFHCEKWRTIREEIEQRVGVRLTKENVINVMTEDREKWQKVSDMIKGILQKKATDSKRERNGQN